MTYTAEMEKAMQRCHKVGYAEYCRKLETRMNVEKEREREYAACKHLIAQFDSKIHR